MQLDRRAAVRCDRCCSLSCCCCDRRGAVRCDRRAAFFVIIVGLFIVIVVWLSVLIVVLVAVCRDRCAAAVVCDHRLSLCCWDRRGATAVGIVVCHYHHRCDIIAVLSSLLHCCGHHQFIIFSIGNFTSFVDFPNPSGTTKTSASVKFFFIQGSETISSIDLHLPSKAQS